MIREILDHCGASLREQRIASLRIDHVCCDSIAYQKSLTARVALWA